MPSPRRHIAPLNEQIKPYLFEFQKHSTPNAGSLFVAERATLPIEVKRVYWICNDDLPALRGGHAHKKLWQVLVAMSGQAQIDMTNLEGEHFSFHLKTPNLGLLVPPFHWRVFTLSPGGVLACFASHEYDSSDYIRDISEFRNFGKKQVRSER